MDEIRLTNQYYDLRGNLQRELVKRDTMDRMLHFTRHFVHELGD